MLIVNMAEGTTPSCPWKMVSPQRVVDVILSEDKGKVLIIDSRSFLEYNTAHVMESVNVCCSKLVKRRLQQDKLSVRDLLAQTCQVDTDDEYEIIVYDQCTSNPTMLSSDCFLIVLLQKLVRVFRSVALLKGGFLEFQASHQSLCETKATGIGAGGYKCPTMTSMSQPCLPVTNLGPTKVLPFLYLGSQHDALSQETVNKNGINYILNVSLTCPKPSCIQEGHFLRIPVNDNHSDKLLPHFQAAFQFIDKVREANGCVLIHCLAGISRSPTLAIGYIMKHLSMSTDDAYKYVKDKRPTISPNFNFLGQLLELEKHLKEQNTQPALGEAHKAAIAELRSPTSPTLAIPRLRFCRTQQPELNAQSPTTAFAKLSFGQLTPTDEHPMTPEGDVPFKQFPTTSLDKLSFTPCFVNEEPLLRSSACAAPKLTQGSGTKRPLSLSDMDMKGEQSAKSTACNMGGQSSKSDCNRESRNTCVPMRSPETRAKRPSVRPNSIAFSTYPKFDFADQCASSSTSTSSSSNDRGVLKRDRSLEESTSTRSRPRVPKHLPVPSMDISPNRNADHPSNIMRNFEQARKSRSLEDILNSPEEEDRDCGCPGRSHSQRKCRKGALDLFPPPIGQARCRGTSDPHQSNSSISSSGSHNSLHGSLEIIQVS